MIPIVVVGAAGRMGRTVIETAAGHPVLKVKAGVDRVGPPAGWDASIPWTDDPEKVLASGDVAVEFSGPEGAARVAAACAKRGAALVSGATGLTDADDAAVRRAAERVAILRSANFSLGVLALRRALSAVLPALPGWDVEIVEKHHRGKKDSPSGTALALAGDVTEARAYPASSLRLGRAGPVGPRANDEVGVHAVRGGSWVGDHTVLLAGAGEWIELRHVAQDRTAFARGALAAAEFVVKAGPGLYTFEVVLDEVAR